MSGAKRGRKTARKDHRVPWTEAETRELLRLRDKGVSLADCAKRLNRVEDLVVARWRDMAGGGRMTLAGPEWSRTKVSP